MTHTVSLTTCWRTLDQNYVYIVEQSLAETVYSSKSLLRSYSVLLIDETLLSETMLSRSRKKKCHFVFFKRTDGLRFQVDSATGQIKKFHALFVNQLCLFIVFKSSFKVFFVSSKLETQVKQL